MSLNPKQRRFAHEYSVDHNAAQAATRAGYSPKTAKEAGSRLMAKVAVRQLVAKLDAETNAELGVTAAGALAMAMELWEMSIEQQPKVWKGKPITYLSELDDGSTVTKTVTELRSPSGAAKALELIFRKAGLDVARTTVEHSGDVVYTLKLDRDLSAGDPQHESEEPS